MNSIQLEKEKNITLVVVYLGDSIPNYVFKNIDLLSGNNQESEIVLVVDKGMKRKIKSKCHSACKIWEYESIDFVDEKQLSNYHDLEFRNGYWKHTILRIVAFLDFQIENGIKNALHLEADMNIMDNFPYKKVALQSKTIWGYYNEKRDVGALVFVPNPKIASWMREQVISTWTKHPNLTDMEILKKIANSNPKDISYWPSGLTLVTNHNSDIPRALYSAMQSREINIGGIVDVAPFGMWLYGIDPNNQYGISVHFSKSFIENGDSFVDPSSAKYIFDEDGTLLVEVGNKREPIFALHNHSKNLKYFGSQGVDKLKKNYGKFTKKRAPYASFSPKIFMSLVFQKLWKRTRKSFKRSFWRNV